MQSESKKQVDVARLRAEVAAAGVEILSAHCAADRVRLQYSAQEVVKFGERSTLKKAIASSEAVYRFFAQIDLELKTAEKASR